MEYLVGGWENFAWSAEWESAHTMSTRDQYPRVSSEHLGLVP